MADNAGTIDGVRHPSEIPLAIAGTVVLIGLLSGAGVLLAVALGGWGIALLVLAFLGLYIARGFTEAAERTRSVLIGTDQFPEVHERIQHYATAFGLNEVPDAYMVQEGGSLNAFASKHNRTNFIRINSDIFEVGSFDAGLRAKDPKALDFIVAHEVGHVAAGHVTYWYTFLSSFIFYVPLLGQALSRAKEYTADNYAYAVAPDGIQGITMLSGGKYLYGQVDGRKFAERAANDGGFFIWLVNAFSSHPVQTKRHQALYDRKRAGRIL